MWLSHHGPDQLDRCITVGGRHVCRRCAVLYPLSIAVAVAQVAGAVPDRWAPWVMWLAPLPVVAEWMAEQLGGARYSPVRQVILTAVASLSLGVALGRHARHPFELDAVAPMLTYTVLCLAAWVVARRFTPAVDPDWEERFEEDERRREDEMRQLLGLEAEPIRPAR